MLSNKKFIFKIKPKFNKKIIFLRLLPIHAFISLWLGFFSGIVAHKITSIIAPLYLGIGIGIVTFILFPVVTLLYCKSSYSNTQYYIYKDRIEYKKGLFNFRTKKIFFKDVAEVNLKMNIFQNRTELGNILLANHKGKKSCKKFNGICMKDIPDSVLIYKKLSDLMF